MARVKVAQIGQVSFNADEPPEPAPPATPSGEAAPDVTVAYEIDTTTDALNEGLEASERGIVDLQLGTEGRVEIEWNILGDADGWLAFRKTKAGWRLVLERANHEDVILLLAGSRDDRIKAAAKLDELLTLLLETSHGRLRNLREAVEHVESFRERIAREAKR